MAHGTTGSASAGSILHQPRSVWAVAFGPGGKIASLFSFVKSKITGEPYDAENETVNLSGN